MKRIIALLVLIAPFLLGGCSESKKLNPELFRDRFCRLTGALPSADYVTVENDSLDFSLSLTDGTPVFFRCREEESGELVRIQLVFEGGINPDTVKSAAADTIRLFVPGAENSKITEQLVPDGTGKTDFGIIRESDAFAEYSAVITKEGIGITIDKH